MSENKTIQKEKIHICFASDDNYAPYMGIAILSILKNAGTREDFYFYILDNKISDTNKIKIESLHTVHPFALKWLKIDEKLFSKCDTRHKGWTLSIFGRYLIPQLIPADKIIYLDCDIMARGSLLPLWKTDINNYYLAGVPDYNVIQRGQLEERFKGELSPTEYVNSGVLLINNKKWREEKLFDKLLDYSIKNSKILLWPDQDAINFICRKGKKILPGYWNVMGYLYKTDLFADSLNYEKIIKEREKAIIRHFHPWKKNYFIPHREEYLKLMKISPWADKTPKDDPLLIAYTKAVSRYFWRHPFCFLLPKFYKRWYHRGSSCLFIDW